MLPEIVQPVIVGLLLAADPATFDPDAAGSRRCCLKSCSPVIVGLLLYMQKIPPPTAAVLLGGEAPRDREAFNDRIGTFAVAAQHPFDPKLALAIDDRLLRRATCSQRDRLSERVHDLVIDAGTRIRPRRHQNLVAIASGIHRGLNRGVVPRHVDGCSE